MTAELNDLFARCDRSLRLHGNRSPQSFLDELDTDGAIDLYGDGGAVERIEAEVATLLGKHAVVFMPSGTMAQQIALRVHASRRHLATFGCHPTCHLELHEDDAFRRLHGLDSVRVGDARGLLTTADIRAVEEPLGAFLFELPQREIGGVLPEWPDLVEQVAVARDRGAAVHLDGARLWECTPHYEKTLDEIAGLFDTVYVSFYKGLGALSGCCLAGEPDVIDEARLWRHRHGGTLWSMWPLAASAVGALARRLPLMPRYYEHARAIAAALERVKGVEVVPAPPHTPMMHLHLTTTAEHFTTVARALAEDEGIATWTSSYAADTPSIRVAELGVGDATLAFTPAEIAEIVERFVSLD